MQGRLTKFKFVSILFSREDKDFGELYQLAEIKVNPC